MSEFEWAARAERPSLRRAIRHQLQCFDRSLKVVAEEFLAATSTIDLLGIGAEGELVSVRIGHEGDDGALLTRALSDLDWLGPRLPGLRQLAPELGLQASAGARAILICPSFSEETRGAQAFLPSTSIELLGYRCFRLRGQLDVVLEAQKPAPRLRDFPTDPLSADLPEPAPAHAGFRTGLSDEDLQVCGAEIKDPALAHDFPSNEAKFVALGDSD